jgi:hypothetical protein
MPSEATFLLDAESLLSKWGFGDGGALGEWWWDNFDEPEPFDDHRALFVLVVTYLVPVLAAAGWTVELTYLETNHNPVRAETLNGAKVDWYDTRRVEFDPPIWAEVTRDQILAALEGVHDATRETR